MKHIVIFSNCAGYILQNMFVKHPLTKDRYIVNHIANYKNLNKHTIDETHVALLNNCDVFIYQPFNQNYSETQYDITNIINYLRGDAKIFKINYYRFRGFWYDSEYKPYNKYNNYEFLNLNYYGIHNSFKNFTTSDKNEIVDKINRIEMSSDELLVFFNNELAKLKQIDDNSDVDMFGYFINNYKVKQLFHDPFHPSNLFFYEMFRQLVIKLDNCKLIFEDYDFIKLFDNIELTHWALPILPIVKNILDLNLEERVRVFQPPLYADKQFHMDIYDYYYIRVSPDNFKTYLDQQM